MQKHQEKIVKPVKSVSTEMATKTEFTADSQNKNLDANSRQEVPKFGDAIMAKIRNSFMEILEHNNDILGSMIPLVETLDEAHGNTNAENTLVTLGKELPKSPVESSGVYQIQPKPVPASLW